MNNKAVASLALLAATAFGSASASAQDVRILGRAEFPTKGAFTLQWAGSGFEAVFTGRWLTARINDWGDNAYNIEVDGKTTILNLNPGAHIYTLYAGEPGQHSIRVTRRNGPASGPSYFMDVAPEGNIRRTNPPARRILVLGDSMSTGYGVEGDGPYCQFTHDTENHDLTFGALAAKAFRADIHTVAVEGRGIVHNYGGVATAATPAVSWQTIPSSQNLWKPAAYMPQVVVVARGTNDFDKGDPGPEFDAAYLALLRRIRESYPDSLMVMTTGPMLEDVKAAAFTDSVHGAVETLRKEGDANVAEIRFRSKPSPGEWGCDWHPGRGTHKDMAMVLERLISERLGWTAIPETN